jgi:hypothetical protein
VSDGNTWLFFKASRTDGKPPLDGKGVLFPSLQTVTANFAKFAELLGPTPIIERRHLAHLNEAEGLMVADAEQQFCVLDPAEARMRKRDPLASDAALLFSQFFSRLSVNKTVRCCGIALWRRARVGRPTSIRRVNCRRAGALKWGGGTYRRSVSGKRCHHHVCAGALGPVT